MTANDNNTTIAELKQLVATFRDERNWKKHHTPKNLAMSIAIEAAELMENFQWDDYTETNHQDIRDELADILIYCFNMAETLDIDISQAYRSKLSAAAKKYPIEIFSQGNDSAADYKRVKQAYRAEKNTKK